MTTRGPANAGNVHHLTLYADNTRQVAERRHAFEDAALRRMCTGKYDPARSPKLWEPFAKEAAAAYQRENARFGENRHFTPADRAQFALDYARDFERRVRDFRKHGTRDLTDRQIATITSPACKIR